MNVFKPMSDESFVKLANLHLNDSFSEAHLDLREYLGDGIYLLKNGDLGVAYAFQGVHDEPMAREEFQDGLANFVAGMKTLICGIPQEKDLSNVVIQVISSQRRVAQKSWQKIFSQEISGKILSAEEAALFEHLHLCDRRFFLTIRYAPEKARPKNRFKDLVMLSGLKDPQGAFANEEANLLSQNELFLSNLSSFDSQFNPSYGLKRLEPKALMGYVQNVLLGGRDEKVVVHEHDLHRQIASLAMQASPKGLKAAGEALEDGEKNIRLFFLEQLPPEYGPGHLRSFMDALPLDDWDLVWTFSDGHREMGADLNAKQGFLERKSRVNPLAQEFQKFRASVSRTRPYGRQSLRLITYNITDQDEGRVKSEALNYLGTRLTVERQIPVHMLATSLALNCTAAGHRVKGRQRLIRLDNAAFFLPIFSGPPKDHGKVWRMARDRSPIRFDLFAGEANKFTLCLAESRAGKSVLTNQFILEFLERNPAGICRVIDKQTSYLKLADLLGGRIIKFSEEELKAKSYSPFALVNWDMDDIERLFLLITTVIHQKNKGIEWGGLHDEILREAIKGAFNIHATNLANLSKLHQETAPHPIWRDILAQIPEAAANLEAAGVHGTAGPHDDLGRWTVNLYETGQYGFLFSRYEETQAHEDAPFMVYDLDQIPDPVLRQLAAMIAFGKIVRDLAKLPLSVPKLVILEEFGMLIHGDDQVQKTNTAFIKNLVKICAKLNCQVISISNNVEDFAKIDAGRVMWENSTQKIFLSLGSLYENARSAWEKEFNEAEWQILKSLKKEKQYRRTSCYIRSFNDSAPWRGSFYIPLTAAMDALCTTSASQVEFYKNARAAGKTAAEALALMVSDFPYGQKNLQKAGEA